MCYGRLDDGNGCGTGRAPRNVFSFDAGKSDIGRAALGQFERNVCLGRLIVRIYGHK